MVVMGVSKVDSFQKECEKGNILCTYYKRIYN